MTKIFKWIQSTFVFLQLNISFSNPAQLYFDILTEVLGLLTSHWQWRGTYCLGLWFPCNSVVCRNLISSFVQWRRSFGIFLPLPGFVCHIYVNPMCMSVLLSSVVAGYCLITVPAFLFFSKSFFSQVSVAELTHKASRAWCHVASTFSSSCAEESSALEFKPVEI